MDTFAQIMDEKLSRSIVPPANHLTRQQLEQIRQCFDAFDIDQDGRISADEIATMTRALGQNPTDLEIKEMIEEVDKDGNGCIEWHEFLQLMKARMKDAATQALDIREAFEVFDKDGNGTIDMAELRAALTQIGEKMTDEEVQELFAEADTNHDGSLDYEEFVTIMSGDSVFGAT